MGECGRRRFAVSWLRVTSQWWLLVLVRARRDRVPYLTTIRNGTVSPIMADNVISSNLMVAGGGANGGAIDNDDGSSFYSIHDNFFVYGGHKSDFDGVRGERRGVSRFLARSPRHWPPCHAHRHHTRSTPSGRSTTSWRTRSRTETSASAS